jgi:hypothetical protein
MGFVVDRIVLGGSEDDDRSGKRWIGVLHRCLWLLIPSLTLTSLHDHALRGEMKKVQV